MRSLIWKEWHEQNWRIYFGAIVFGAIAVIGLRARIIDDQTMVLLICSMGIFLLPIMSSASLVPGERDEKTLESLVSLPVTPARILAVKTAIGALLCIIPLLAAGLLSLLVTQGREMAAWQMAGLFGQTILATLAMFIWMLALTILLPNETRAALLSLGVFFCWSLLMAGLLDSTFPDSPLVVSPLAFIMNRIVDHNHFEMTTTMSIQRFFAVLAVQTVVCALLWVWAKMRFSAMEDRS